MTINILELLHSILGISFIIEDGKVKKVAAHE